MMKEYVRTGVDELPAELLEQFVDFLFQRISAEILGRQEISRAEKAQFRVEAQSFDGHLQKILKSKSLHKELALRAVARALSFSFYHAGGTKVIQELRAEGISRQGFKAGRASGVSRRSLAEQMWQAHALKLANESHIKNSNGSLDEVADHIFGNWKIKIKPVGRQWMKQFISQQIKSGGLPAKTKTQVPRNTARNSRKVK